MDRDMGRKDDPLGEVFIPIASFKELKVSLLVLGAATYYLYLTRQHVISFVSDSTTNSCNEGAIASMPVETPVWSQTSLTDGRYLVTIRIFRPHHGSSFTKYRP